MKKILKYIIAVLIFVSAGTAFMPMASLAAFKLSVVDIIKLGLGKSGNFSFLQDIESLLTEYVKNYVYLLLILLIGIIAAAIFTALLPERNVYIVSIICQVMINVLAVVVYLQLKDKIGTVRSAVDFFGMGGNVKLYAAPVILWLILYLAAFALSIYGLLMKESEYTDEKNRVIMPESFHATRNPWHSSRENSGRGKMYLERIRQLEDERKGQNQNPVDPLSYKDFEGAIVGKNGIYKNKAYLLKERVPVYFCKEGMRAFVSQKKMGTVLAILYYVLEYQEYCVIPEENGTVYLESGQPLGGKREYYLPRGIEIYLEDKNQMFILA